VRTNEFEIAPCQFECVPHFTASNIALITLIAWRQHRIFASPGDGRLDRQMPQ
jgi:hypothetical protein